MNGQQSARTICRDHIPELMPIRLVILFIATTVARIGSRIEPLAVLSLCGDWDLLLLSEAKEAQPNADDREVLPFAGRTESRSLHVRQACT